MITEKDDDEEILILASECNDDYDDEDDEIITDPKERKKLLKKIKKAKREEKEKNKTGLQIFAEYLRVIAIAALVAFLVCKFVIINAKVPSESMEPTIMTGDRLIGLRMPYYFSDPKRGDIVIFETPDPANKGDLYIKRVIGLPGETVVIVEGKVRIVDKEGNITELEENYLPSNYKPYNPNSSINNQSVTLGDDEYFMMGDNRNHSSDSRAWGPVKRKAIKAKAWLRYYKGFKFY